MRRLIYDPSESGKKMTIACFISGSGTNYQQLVARNPNHKYIVFTNRPECGGMALARGYNHDIITLSHLPYLKDAINRFGQSNVPRNCPERMAYEQEISRLIEKKSGKVPDLICLLGYDQWLTDWMVDRYYPRIINVHPGDTTKGYDGLHWIPSAKAILAGDKDIRSTLFIVDKGEDTGPVLVQSEPLDIAKTLAGLESKGQTGLSDMLRKITGYSSSHNISSYNIFKIQADTELLKYMELICKNLQNELKISGDWEIYPFAVHDLISQGRVELDGRTVYIDGKLMPLHGYKMGK
jgi:folate-dependent phosphoribosylglycinamide formyltransferase PurN